MDSRPLASSYRGMKTKIVIAGIGFADAVRREA